MLAALLNVTGWMVLMGLALLWLPASEAALIAYTMPVWASLLAWPVLGERPTILRTVALVMAFAGLAAIMGGNGFSATAAKLPGMVMALGGAIGFALGTVLAKKLPVPLPPIPAAAWQIGLGCFPIVIIGLAFETTHIEKVTQLGWWLSGLFDRDPVLHRLCELVRRARPPAGLGGGDRHHGGAGHRRRRVRDGARRAARRRSRSRRWCSRSPASCWRQGPEAILSLSIPSLAPRREECGPLCDCNAY